MIESFGLSDAGCVRSNNEDYYVLAPEAGLYVVADGMGGAQAGEHASKLAAETVVETVLAAKSATPETLLNAFEEANRRVLQAASNDSNLEGMGTTLVAALEGKNELLIASVGDSRAYIYENDELLIITEDQTWVHEVGRRLGLDEAALKSHPMRHVLTMAIGVSSQLRVHTYALSLMPGYATAAMQRRSARSGERRHHPSGPVHRGRSGAEVPVSGGVRPCARAGPTISPPSCCGPGNLLIIGGSQARISTAAANP